MTPSIQPRFGAIHTVISNQYHEKNGEQWASIPGIATQELVKLLDQSDTYYDSAFGAKVREQFRELDPDYKKTGKIYSIHGGDVIATGKEADLLQCLRDTAQQVSKVAEQYGENGHNFEPTAYAVQKSLDKAWQKVIKAASGAKIEATTAKLPRETCEKLNRIASFVLTDVKIQEPEA